MPPTDLAERFYRAGQDFHCFHFERAGYMRLGSQAARKLQLLEEVRAFAVSPRD
jgi:hypothetical protein